MGSNIRLANALAAPIFLLAVIAVGFYFCRRYRKKVAAMAEQRTRSVSDIEAEIDTYSARAFFQSKAELVDEERSIYELEAKERRYEIEKTELLAGERDHKIQNLQELGGEEHSKELEAPIPGSIPREG